MRRTAVVTAIAFGVFVFLGISFLLARGLSGAGAERGRVLEVLRAQARGDADAVLADLPACRRQAACARVTRDRVARLKRPGEVQILNYRPSAQLSLTRKTGSGRVAWRAGSGLPIVQCVRVRREGPLTGGGLELLALSDPIRRDGSC
ncbi:MAG TPA: hypothetical protein VN213_18905 [Solirubrobacteraceae bacterium]|nr:hypothetical protein [Solirubrobacteraceae bacterium]